MIVLCAGPARASQTIREALAKGADRALHIEEEDLSSADPLALARLMAKALESEKPDLILTGLQSDDFGYGQTGVILAELMGLPSATIIMSVDINGAAIKVKRELENGWFQHVEMPLARAAHHAIRQQQAPLRDPDGHQESQEQRDQAPHGWRNWEALPRHPSGSTAFTCRSAPRRARSSMALRKKPPHNWSRNSNSKRGSCERISDSGAAP